jgi:hypothetical protein
LTLHLGTGLTVLNVAGTIQQLIAEVVWA